MTKNKLMGLSMCRRRTSTAPSSQLDEFHSRYNELLSDQQSDRMLSQLLQACRRDVLRLRREYKHLRDREAAQALANLHLNYRIETLDTVIRSQLEHYAALRLDLSMQRNVGKRTVKMSAAIDADASE